jgi:hypothetical protein
VKYVLRLIAVALPVSLMGMKAALADQPAPPLTTSLNLVKSLLAARFSYSTRNGLFFLQYS